MSELKGGVKMLPNKGLDLFPHTSCPPYLLSLYQLLIDNVWERPQGTELASALCTHEDAVLIHDTSPADGDQWYTVAAHVLIQVEVSTLHLGAG